MIWLNKTIGVKASSHFRGNAFAHRIAKVVDILVGTQLNNMDKTLRGLVKTINFHFDDPAGRIVKIETKLDKIEEKLDALDEKVEDKFDKIMQHLQIPTDD